MQVLKKGMYYFKDKDGIRLWHDCKEYKDYSIDPETGKKTITKRDLARVEINKISENEEIAKFKCSLCAFEYEFDKTLRLG